MRWSEASTGTSRRSTSSVGLARPPGSCGRGARVTARASRIDQRRPGEVDGAHAAPGVRVVVLAQAAAPSTADAIRSPAASALLAVAEPDQAEPHQPGRVDPRRSAPVAPDPRASRSSRSEKLGSVAGTDGGGTGSQNCARVEQVLLDQPPADVLRQVGEGQRRERRPGERRTTAAASGATSGSNRPVASSYIRSTIVGVSDGRPSASSESPWRTLVDTSQHTGPPAAGDPAQVVAEPAVAPDEQDEPGPVVGAPAPDRVELRRGVEPRLVGLDDPDQPVAVEVAVGAQPVVVADDRGHRRRVADRDPPRPREHRRLDAGGHRGVRRGHVVGEPPAAGQRRVPEDRVADEAVLALGGQQRLELAPGALPGRSAAS